MRPTLIDLFCGKGGWSKAAIKRGWQTIGLDITDLDYPGTFIKRKLPTDIRDILALNPTLVVASPPCEDYARRHLPWIQMVGPLDERLLRWSIDLAQQLPCPTIIECSKFADRELPGGMLFGSYALWGDVPALVPILKNTKEIKSGKNPGNRAEIPDALAGWIIDTARTKKAIR